MNDIDEQDKVPPIKTVVLMRKIEDEISDRRDSEDFKATKLL